MNDKGVAPYWNLIKEQNWHFYKSGAIIHDSKKSDVDILKNKDLKCTLSDNCKNKEYSNRSEINKIPLLL